MSASPCPANCIPVPAVGCANGFPSNPDVSGIGVRVSFYGQAIGLALLAVRSQSVEEIVDVLQNLTITNVAYCMACLILGFKSDPQLSLYDGIVVCYLLTISSIAILFAVAHHQQYSKADPRLHAAVAFQFYLVACTIIAVFAHPDTFGTENERACSHDAKVVVFHAFNVLQVGRGIILGLASAGIVVFTLMLALDYIPRGSLRARSSGTRVPRRQEADDGLPKPDFDHVLAMNVVFIAGIAAVLVDNTERLRHHNHISDGDNQWGFGQLLPMFLIAIPVIRTVILYQKHGLKRLDRE